MRHRLATVIAFIFISQLLSMGTTTTAFAEPILPVSNQYKWTFQPSETSDQISVRADYYLADQISAPLPCCTGIYRVALPTSDIGRLGTGPFSIYFPSVGGLKRVQINNRDIYSTSTDHSSVGPILPIPNDTLMETTLYIEVYIESPRSFTSGIWKRVPEIAVLPTLITRRDADKLHQIIIPIVNGLILILGAALFYFVYRSTLRKFKGYLYLSLALASSSIFFLFLGGAARNVSYEWGSYLHLSSRIILSIGIYKCLSIRFTCSRTMNQWTVGILAFMSLLCAFFGIVSAPITQKLLVVLAGLLSFAPLFKESPHKLLRTNWGYRLFFLLAWTALLAQSSDAIKLFDGTLGFKHPLPYLNRFVLGPILLVSIGNIIVHFSGVFFELKRHLFRMRGNTRSSFLMATSPELERDLPRFVLHARRVVGVRKGTVSKKDPKSGEYLVASVSGVPQDALGSTIRVNTLPHIGAAIKTGHIQIADLPSRTGSHWRTTRCAAVPIPEKPEPEFLLLLSDPLSNESLTAADAPYLSQFSSALWSNIDRARKTQAKLRLEQQLQDAFKALDPSLFAFVSGLLNKGPEQSLKVSEFRGIIFFDQKGYTQLLEGWDDSNAATLAELMARWLAPVVARYNGRVVNFEGDACLVEVVGLNDESPESIAKRTANIAWHLSSSLPELNQRLLQCGFDPITYRFGAHLGKAATISLDFIQTGLRNTVGDNVNVAKRIQQLAPTGKVFLSKALASHVASEFEAKHVGERFVKGRGGSIDVYELVAVRISQGVAA